MKERGEEAKIEAKHRERAYADVSSLGHAQITTGGAGGAQRGVGLACALVLFEVVGELLFQARGCENENVGECERVRERDEAGERQKTANHGKTSKSPCASKNLASSCALSSSVSGTHPTW